ncbi:MAG: hypothetical protein AB1411_07980, partial [Nitrospirota bacterium]
MGIACLLGLESGPAMAQEPPVAVPPVSVTEPKSLSEGHEELPKPQGERPTTGRSLAVESTPLEDVLLEKGVINRDDWLRIKAEEERRQFERATE